jgi:hypothetical protein
MFILSVVFLGNGQVVMAQTASAKFDYSQPKRMQYDFVQKYSVHHREYQDVNVSDFVESFEDANQGPDRLLLSMISALKHEDFEWWKSTFDHATLADWETKAGINKADIEYRKWLDRASEMESIRLKQWYGVSDVIFIGFDIVSESNHEKAPAYFLVPLVLENSRWKISLGYMQSALYVKLLEDSL